jgi:hypothetical protein
MADISYTQSKVDGVALPAVAATAGPDRVRPDERGIVVVHNTSGVSSSIGIVDPTLTKYGKATGDLGPTVVPAGAHWSFGPFPADLMDLTDGFVDITATPFAGVNFYGVRA